MDSSPTQDQDQDKDESSNREWLRDESTIMKGSDSKKAEDFNNYFSSYAYLYHQKQMLMDHNRMQAYHQAIMKNRSLFEGKTVVDVGTGSGILAVWSGKAGASKVWAVEFTDMARHARTVVKNNGLEDVVTVLKGAAEDIDVPEKSVDIIISEWMGYFLLRESMLDSLIRARDRLLKPTGALYPSHATMLWAIVSCEDEREAKIHEFDQTLEDWDTFTGEAASKYSVNLSCLDQQYHKEQKDYFLASSAWCELSNDNVVGTPVEVKSLDLNTCTISDSMGVHEAPFRFVVTEPATVSGFGGWFDTTFAGSPDNPCAEPPVVLSTHPRAGYTHWGQQVFFLEQPIEMDPRDVVEGTMTMTRRKGSERLYNLTCTFKVLRPGCDVRTTPQKCITWEIP